MRIKTRAWHWGALLVLVATAIVASRLLLRQGPPEGTTLDTLIDKAEALGWESYKGYDSGKGVFFVSRALNPSAREHGGSAQEGCLYISERASEEEAAKDGSTFKGADSWGRFFLSGDPRMMSQIMR